MGVGKELAKSFAGIERTRLALGTCVSIDWPTRRAVVNVGGGLIPAIMVGTQPIIGRPVWLAISEDAVLAIGSPAGPSLGTISGTPSGGFVSVIGDDGSTYSLNYLNSYTPSSGHRVAISWNGVGLILGQISAAAAVVAPDAPAAPTGKKEKSARFYATDSASWRAGRWQPDVYYSLSSDPGAWFYGSQIKDTIPDTATILEVRIYLEVMHKSGNSLAYLGTHVYGSRPGSGFSISNLTSIGSAPLGFKGDVGLPTSFGDLLKVGTALGIGTEGLGYRIFAGTQRVGASGALFIKWRE